MNYSTCRNGNDRHTTGSRRGNTSSSHFDFPSFLSHFSFAPKPRLNDAALTALPNTLRLPPDKQPHSPLSLTSITNSHAHTGKVEVCPLTDAIFLIQSSPSKSLCPIRWRERIRRWRRRVLGEGVEDGIWGGIYSGRDGCALLCPSVSTFVWI